MPHRPRLRTLTLVAAAAGALVVGSLAVPVLAGQGDDRKPVITEEASPRCGPAQRDLARADDRFAQGCLAGQDIARLDDSDATLPEGRIASRKMSLVANLEKTGPFAEEGALNSDLAFQGKYAYAGNYNGFAIYDISKPGQVEQVTQVLCPGSQNDISVLGDILVLSTDSSRSDNSCASTPQDASEESSWEGLKVFDISDPVNPRYVSSVETDCGSHTHTLAPNDSGKQLFVYVSSYSPDEDYPDCLPPHDSISIVRIPVAAPDRAELAGTPVLFPEGGHPETTSGCHDITAYPSKDIAAGACMGDGILLDISKRRHPVVTEQVRDTTNFAFWHSATFNNDGTKVVFTDELGGGGAPTCNPTTGSVRGANGIYDIIEGQLVLQSYYKMPRTQTNEENCVAHNGSLIPVPGRDIMVQAWYQGGVSVFDFTNSSRPRELAWFDRGPVNEAELEIGGSWSAYWYNGYVYSNEIARGFDVLKIARSVVGKAGRTKLDVFNAQSQPNFNG